MSIFSNRRGRKDDSDADDDMVVDGASVDQIPDQLQMVMPDVADPAAMRDFITKRLVVESQMADSPSARISALKTLADITTIKEETKFRVDKRLTDSTTNIVVIQEALRDAKQRALR